MKWILLLLLVLGIHFGASYVVPLDEKAQATFAGLLRWAWPWAYGNSGPLGTISPGPSGFPVTGFFIAVTSAGLFLLAALAVFGIWVPFAWWRVLTIAGAVVSLVLMILFFGPTKILPMLVDFILIYSAWNNWLPSVK